jgi:hypothetical protein
VGEGLLEEDGTEGFVVDECALLGEEPVEGAPVMVGEAKGKEGLGYGAPGEAQEVAEEEGLGPLGGRCAPGRRPGDGRAANGVGSRAGGLASGGKCW